MPKRVKARKARLYTYYWNHWEQVAGTSTWETEFTDLIREAHPDYDFELLGLGCRVRSNSDVGDMIELSVLRNISKPTPLTGQGTVDGHGCILQWRQAKVVVDGQEEEWVYYWPFPEPFVFNEYDKLNLYCGGQNSAAAARVHALFVYFHYKLK